MPAIGPVLPPHILAKRKREQEADADNENAIIPGAKRQKSPPINTSSKKHFGPALPPAPLDERPQEPVAGTEESNQQASEGRDEEDSDDDDDFGPSMPTSQQTMGETQRQHSGSDENGSDSAAKEPNNGTQRAAWMMMPPKQDDLAARMDPSRIRARGFNTGKSATAKSGGSDESRIWTETPEEKRRRLEDQVMGVKSTTSVTNSAADARMEAKRVEDLEMARNIKDSRGKSLVELHVKTAGKVEEDDPSARAFDREKDIAGGIKIGAKQRNELLNHAAGIGSKFSSGSFL